MKQSFLSRLKKDLVSHSFIYLLMLPGLVYFLIFHYGPMYGLSIAFVDFQYAKGILRSPFIGFKYFKQMFDNPQFWVAFQNTIRISLLRLVCNFPAPIILALLLNELRHRRFKKAIQTISYLPHFMSWVVLGSIFTELLSPTRGVINYFITFLGGQSIYFLADRTWFIAVLIVTGMWQSVGWGSIIYLAAISSIDQEQYESAYVDGAGRLQQAWYITLPSLIPVISIMLLLSLSGILNAGFDQIFNLDNDAVLAVSEILDTYVYRRGLLGAQFSLTTAVGLVKNVISMVLVLITNYIIKRANGYGVW